MLISNFRPPTGKSLSDKEKDIVAEYANKQNALVIEDNAYEFLSYGNKKLNSVKARNTIKINSFSKVLSPSLRLGFLITDNDDIYKQLRSMKITMNLSTSSISQSIIYNTLNNNNFIEKWQQELEERACILKSVFYDKLNKDIIMGSGGSFVKLDLNSNIDIECFIKLAKKYNIFLDNNKNQYVDNKSRHYVRLNLGAVTNRDIFSSVLYFENIFSELKYC